MLRRISFDGEPPLSLVWFCGLFEGEGCVIHTTRSGYTGLTIKMTDRDVLEIVQEHFGGNINGPYYPKNCLGEVDPDWKPQYRWQMGMVQAIPLARKMIPFMGERRRVQLEKLIDQGINNAQWANRTECINGHSLTPDNIAVVKSYGSTKRLCRTCRSNSQRRYKERKSAEKNYV